MPSSTRRAVLECCVDSLASAEAAVQGGAARLEVCSALSDGGLTPSLGLFIRIRERFPDVFLTALIRPRAGDFCYSEDEVRVMEKDVELLSREGADGIAIGPLTQSGEVDEAQAQKLIKAASPRSVEVTFHRAIDVSMHPADAVRTCVRLGITRILTSGCAPSAAEGTARIRRMVSVINELFPGSKRHEFIVAAAAGVSETNAVHILNQSGADQLHGSLKEESPRPPVRMFSVERLSVAGDEEEQSKHAQVDLSEHFGKVFVTSKIRVEKLLATLNWREETGTDHAKV